MNRSRQLVDAALAGIRACGFDFSYAETLAWAERQYDDAEARLFFLKGYRGHVDYPQHLGSGSHLWTVFKGVN